ncbi:unnamed protein product [Phytomonas sp. Hart1]|nr:unnamed protein product [Phytomonas sp. Hart1]|eukprot:CCW69795.1 unnamed protein product [Phytomonas sp. isolate Hart1]
MLSQTPFEESPQPGDPPALTSNLAWEVESSSNNRETRAVESGMSPVEGSLIISDSAPPKPRPPSYRSERKPLAKFSVGKPFKGKEILRPITYFPILVEVLVKNDGEFTTPEVPTGVHPRLIRLGVKRNDWSRPSGATVERRYKELMELREILTYQFPGMIIPPLPDKDGVNHLETYFNAADQMLRQRYNIQFFLSEIAAMPEVMFFSEWVPPFFLDPRETFETGTLTRLQAALKDLRLVNKTVDLFKRRNCGFVESTTNKIAKKSTKLVRSIAGLFWGEGGDGMGPGENPRAQWSVLPRDLQEDAKAWEAIVDVLNHHQGLFKKAAKSFETFLDSTNNWNTEQTKAASAMADYGTTLRKAECFTQLAEHFHNASSMMSDVAEKERQLADKRYFNVCLRLRFEYNYIDSVLNAIDHVLSLYRSLASDVYDVKDAFYLSKLQYTTAINEGLMRDYTQRYRRYYIYRMRNLLSDQLVKPTLESISVIEETTQNAPFVCSIKQNDSTNY